jgi:hypothetical protein
VQPALFTLNVNKTVTKYDAGSLEAGGFLRIDNSVDPNLATVYKVVAGKLVSGIFEYAIDDFGSRNQLNSKAVQAKAFPTVLVTVEDFNSVIRDCWNTKHFDRGLEGLKQVVTKMQQHNASVNVFTIGGIILAASAAIRVLNEDLYRITYSDDFKANLAFEKKEVNFCLPKLSLRDEIRISFARVMNAFSKGIYRGVRMLPSEAWTLFNIILAMLYQQLYAIGLGVVLVIILAILFGMFGFTIYSFYRLGAALADMGGLVAASAELMAHRIPHIVGMATQSYGFNFTKVFSAGACSTRECMNDINALRETSPAYFAGFYLCYLFYLFLFKRIVVFLLKRAEWQMIKTSCIQPNHFKECEGELCKDVRWKLSLSPHLTEREFLSLECDNSKQGLKSIVEPSIDGAKPIIFHACTACIYAATRRYCGEVPDYDELELAKFLEWHRIIFEKEVVPILKKFVYSFEKWFNHLNAKQQAELRDIDSDAIPLDDTAQSFNKVAKDLYEIQGAAPKVRNICNPNKYHKYVLGPVTYSLEYYFGKYLKGYCGGKSWEATENMYNDWADQGLTRTYQLDGSFFEKSQRYELKAVDRMIFNWLAANGKIKHVSLKTFLFFANTEWRTIQVFAPGPTMGIKKTRRCLGNVRIRGKTLSGDMQTTLMNTYRMVMYNRYTMEVYVKCRYDLAVKGDDVVVVTPWDVDPAHVKICFELVFIKKGTSLKTKHGLGQVMKYLKIGTLEDIDFCSTFTYYNRTHSTYKIVRQFPRFINLTPWSRKAVSFAPAETAIYRHALNLSNKAWCAGLKLFEAYNQHLETDISGLKIKTVQFISKLKVKSIKIDDFHYFDRDYYHSNLVRQSSHPNCEDSFRHRFCSINFLTYQTYDDIISALKSNTHHHYLQGILN